MVSVKSNEEPGLSGDMRYTPRTAAYWRSKGLTILDEWIFGSAEENGEELVPENNVVSWRWIDAPFTVEGKRRYKINYKFHWDIDPESPYYELKHDEEQKQRIRESLDFIQARTCLTFEEQFSLGNYPGGLLQFIIHSGCWANVGRDAYREYGNNDNPKTRISLGPNCLSGTISKQYRGTIQHEVLHALGVLHEQGRYDRDEYIKIHEENIDEDKIHNFNKVNEEAWIDMSTPYDFKSIMQYSGMSNSNNGKATITYKDGPKQGEPIEGIGGNLRSFGMSSMDLYQICKMYECQQCDGTDIPTYKDAAHETYMYQCERVRIVTYNIINSSYLYSSILNFSYLQTSISHYSY